MKAKQESKTGKQIRKAKQESEQDNKRGKQNRKANQESRSGQQHRKAKQESKRGKQNKKAMFQFILKHMNVFGTVHITVSLVGGWSQCVGPHSNCPPTRLSKYYGIIRLDPCVVIIYAL